MPLDKSFAKRCFLGVEYAALSPAQKLDLYLPGEGEGPFPVILYIHGGGFKHGDKAQNQLIPFLYGLYRGYAVASLNYRLSGEACFPASVLDVKAAIRFLRANAEQYCLDPLRFIATGASAGGYMTAMACATGNISSFDDASLGYPEVSSAVQAGVAWFPPTDFSRMDEQIIENGVGIPNHNDADSYESYYLGGTLSELPEDAIQAANPITYVHSGMTPILIQHGRLDRLVPFQQSVMLAKKIREIAGPDKVQLDLLEYADHVDLWFLTVDNMQKVFAFIDNAMENLPLP